MITRTSVIFAALSMAASSSSAAGFDCQSVQNDSERIVCSSPELSRADELLNRYFRLAVASVETERSVRKAQRAWIAERNRCKDEQCIKLAYQGRVRELFELVRHSQRSAKAVLPGKQKVAKLCALIADEESRQLIMAQGGDVLDVNNDGLAEETISCPDPESCPTYTTPGDERINPSRFGYEYKTFWPEKVDMFRYQDSSYLIAESESGLPRYVSFVAPNNTEYMLCDFAYSNDKKVAPNSWLCRDIQHGFKNMNYITHFEKVSSKKFEGRPETNWESKGFIDFDNDGIEELVAEVSYTTMRGYGSCPYYELLDKSAASVSEGVKRRLLLKLQGVKIESTGRPRCEGAGRFVVDQTGKTYFQVSRHPEPNVLRKLENGVVTDECSITEREYANVNRYYPFDY